MELGNWIFGVSRGEVPILRGAGYETLLNELFEAVDKEHNKNTMGYGFDFENDTFEIHPYYWGDCPCGYEKLEYEWYENNKHKEDCYQTIYRKLEKEYESILKIPKKKVKELCIKYGIYYNRGIGSAIHCTCDYSKNWHKFLESNGHKKDCLMVRPNFLYKSTGYELMWYKYPLRDSYASEELSLIKFTNMIKDCINSIERREE